jgi:hypothetical protein
MKVVHVLKRIEMIDEDIKELRKLEKTIARDKSFSTPIYMSIEKQINLMLGERIKLLELQISNPPETLVQEIEGGAQERKVEPAKKVVRKKAAPARPRPEPSARTKQEKNTPDDYELEDDISILTQEMIDARISDIRASEPKKETAPVPQEYSEDESIKLLDIALEKGTLNRKDIEKEKKVRFFRENFPTD